jgi:hypothetical protein
LQTVLKLKKKKKYLLPSTERILVHKHLFWAGVCQELVGRAVPTPVCEERQTKAAQNASSTQRT